MHAPPFVPASRSTTCSPERVCSRQNVGENERLVSLFGGAALLVNAFFGPKRSRPLSLLAGAGMLYRGWTGHCAGYEAMGISTADSPSGLPQAVASS